MPTSNQLMIDNTLAPAVPAMQADRRTGQRLRTVYRVARVIANGDQGLARVLNISDGGMMIALTLPVRIGDRVEVDLSERYTLSGQVVWHDGRRCGVRFSSSIASGAILRGLYEERKYGRGRPLRLAISRPVIVRSEAGVTVARLRDISQAGVKIADDGRFQPGLPVKVQLAPSLERRGVVRWSRGGVAGILLTELLTVEELGSMNAI